MLSLAGFFEEMKALPPVMQQMLAAEISKALIEEFKKIIHFDTKEVEGLLSISVTTLQTIRLKGTRVGKRVKPTWADLEKFIESHKANYPAVADQEHQKLKAYAKRRVKELRFLDIREKT